MPAGRCKLVLQEKQVKDMAYGGECEGPRWHGAVERRLASSVSGEMCSVSGEKSGLMCSVQGSEFQKCVDTLKGCLFSFRVQREEMATR